MKKVKQTKKSNWPSGHKIKSLIMQYVDVNSMEPDKIGSFLESFNEPMQDIIDQLKAQNIAVITVPIRQGSSTRFEVMHIEEDSIVPTDKQSDWDSNWTSDENSYTDNLSVPAKPKALDYAEKMLKEVVTHNDKIKSNQNNKPYSSDGFDCLDGVQILYCDDGSEVCNAG